MKEMSNITESEQSLYYVINGRGGGFTTKLFELICKADIGNRTKLSLAFPEFVETVWRYENEEGYWEDIQRRINDRGN